MQENFLENERGGAWFLTQKCHTSKFLEFAQFYKRNRDQEVHSEHQLDLVEHWWQLQGKL